MRSQSGRHAKAVRNHARSNADPSKRKLTTEGSPDAALTLKATAALKKAGLRGAAVRRHGASGSNLRVQDAGLAIDVSSKESRGIDQGDRARSARGEKAPHEVVPRPNQMRSL